MDHAEVRAWLADAFFEPGRLRHLDQAFDDDPSLAGLREHLADCARCTAELRSLRATAVALDVGLGPSPANQERMLANVRQLGVERRPQGSRSRPFLGLPRLHALAAALAILVVGLGTGLLLGGDWLGLRPEGPRVANATAVMADLLRDPAVQQVLLRDESGTPAGLVVHSPEEQRVAILSGGLPPSPSGRYFCYLERDGERLPVGPMHFEGQIAFWAGPMGGPPDAGRPGDRFLVLREPEGDTALAGEF